MLNKIAWAGISHFVFISMLQCLQYNTKVTIGFFLPKSGALKKCPESGMPSI